jgi:hypothetical protein
MGKKIDTRGVRTLKEQRSPLMAVLIKGEESYSWELPIVGESPIVLHGRIKLL